MHGFSPECVFRYFSQGLGLRTPDLVDPTDEGLAGRVGLEEVAVQGVPGDRQEEGG